MRVGAAFWIQQTDWPSLRDAAIAAEAADFDSLWLDDHLLNDEGDPDAPKLEGWTAAAAIAAVTSRATIGHLVTANTFRHPALLAKMAVTLDAISEGRAVLGMGAGWFEREHQAYGIDFGTSMGDRLDRLDEAVGIVRRLLDGVRVDHQGRFYRLIDAAAAPRPVQDHLPILIGGSGPRRTLPLVARWADAWNAYGPPAFLAERDAILLDRCRDVGRDPSTIERSTNLNVVIRPSVRAAETAWVSWMARHRIQPGEEDLVGGPPGLVADAIRPYLDIGFDHIVLIFRSPWDLETMERMAEVRELLGA
jgi:F420-dependent oxidoreductase-like protein